MDASLIKFHTFLIHYAETLEAMVKKQEEKYSSLLSFDSTKVFKSVSDLQAATLQIEKLEEQRIALQQEIGFSDMTFRDMMLALPASSRESFDLVFRRLQSAIWDVKFLNEKSLSFAQEGIEALHGDELTAQQNLYASPKDKAAKPAEARPLFDANY